MDYARFNYVAQPGDGVEKLTPRIGEYDRYAIEYAYRWRPVKSPFDEIAQNRAFIDSHSHDPIYFFGPQAGSRDLIDPRSQSEDIGDNAIRASLLGLKSLKAIMPCILQWTDAKDGHYIDAAKFLHDIIDQWHLYAYHVLANVGGIYLDDRDYCTQQPSFVNVPASIQRSAVKYLCDQVFTFPKWLFAGDIYNRILPIKSSPLGPYEYAPMELFKNYQGYIIWDLLQEERLTRIVENQAQHPKSAYTITELFNTLYNCIFGKSIRGQQLTPYDRITQKGYVDALIIACDRSAARKEKKHLYIAPPHSLSQSIFPCSRGFYADPQQSTSFTSAMRHIKFSQLNRVGDPLSIKRGELVRIRRLLLRVQKTGGQENRDHYHDLLLRINDALGIK